MKVIALLKSFELFIERKIYIAAHPTNTLAHEDFMNMKCLETSNDEEYLCHRLKATLL